MSTIKIALILVFFIIIISIQYTLNLILVEIRNIRKDMEIMDLKNKKDSNPDRYKY